MLHHFFSVILHVLSSSVCQRPADLYHKALQRASFEEKARAGCRQGGEVCGGFRASGRFPAGSLWLAASLPRAQNDRGTSCLLIRGQVDANGRAWLVVRREEGGELGKTQDE